MRHLTLQEVIERINQSYPSPKKFRSETVLSPHRPEFYVPRLVRLLVSFLRGPQRADT